MRKFGAVRRVNAAVVAVAAAAALVACSADQQRLEPMAQTDTSVAPEEVARPPKASVSNGATEVEPGQPVTVTSAAGLEKVTMTNEDGKEVESEFNDDKTEWTTAEPLGYGRTYSIVAKDTEGQTMKSSFTTVLPSAQVNAYMSPIDGSEVGAGQAVTIRFDYPIEDTEAMEKLIDVETSNDTEGGFFWLDPYELRWRPKEYWEPGTEVTVKVNLYGRKLAEGVYGAADTETSFTTGDLVEAVVDNNLKLLRVYKNHEFVREFPVALGTDGSFDTPNGFYVVGDRHDNLVMDSRTYGLGLESGGYVTPVDYATQLSYSGIYVHSAPWAIGNLGYSNVSHGCINASPSDAQWFMNYVKRGDIFEVRNTGGETLSPYDGLGYWNLDWEQRSGGSEDPLYE